MREATGADIESLLRAAVRRLRVERGRAALSRGGLALLACLPALLLWHVVLAPVPVTALAILAALALLAAFAAAARAVTRSEAAEWIDRRLDGASTFGTLLEYAHDRRPAAARLRQSARTRAADCVARLARLPHEHSLTRPLAWAGLAVLVAAAVLTLTDGHRSSGEATPPLAQRADDPDAPLLQSEASASIGAETPVAERATADPAAATTAELRARAASAGAAAQVVVEEAAAGTPGPAPGDGDSSSGRSPGREAGAGLDRGGVEPPAPSEARLAVELRKLLGPPTALDQRTRRDLEGRYDRGARVAVVADGAPRPAVAAARPPRTLERTSLDPATAAYLRTYSDTGPR